MIKTSETLPVVEIFDSIQGEGFNTGRNAVFIRLGKCNLSCPWCDTNYDVFKTMKISEILDRVNEITIDKNVIITGGEPTIHSNLCSLVNGLKLNGFSVWIESNGIEMIPKTIDYVAISPKRMYTNIYKKKRVMNADEVRIVIDDIQGSLEFCIFIEENVNSQKYYISPCEVDNNIQWEMALEVLGKLNGRINRKVDWLLSIQTQKFMEIR